MQVIGLPKCGKRHVAETLRTLGHNVQRTKTVHKNKSTNPSPGCQYVLCVPYCNREHQLLEHLRQMSDYACTKGQDPCPVVVVTKMDYCPEEEYQVAIQTYRDTINRYWDTKAVLFLSDRWPSDSTHMQTFVRQSAQIRPHSRRSTLRSVMTLALRMATVAAAYDVLRSDLLTLHPLCEYIWYASLMILPPTLVVCVLCALCALRIRQVDVAEYVQW